MKPYVPPLLILAALLISACYVPSQPAPVAKQAASNEQAPTPAATEAVAAEQAPTAPAAASRIPVEALRNATYSGIYDEPITLTDGLYEGELFVEGDPARPTVETIDGAELFGDLNGDGVDDAVVFLLERGGGTGAFTYVAAQLNEDGKPVDAGAVRIEDRIGVRSAAIEDGQVVLDIITQGPGDVACCGTHKAHKTYALQDGRLVETTPAGGELVKISAADLDGATWTLLELDRDQPALANTEVTLTFGVGQVSGTGGCNSYSGSFSLGEDNPLVMSIGPLTATDKSCPEPAGSQESAYLAALGSVTRWGYDFGRLALYYAGGQDGESRLLFAPSGEVTAPDPDDYLAASSISRDGFAINDDEMRQLDGQEVMLWGYVDHGNLYGDESARELLGDWWSGDGPDASTWRFNLKAQADDAVGKSFAVTVPNDPGRDDLLRAFVADAQAGRPTKVFVTGRLATFDAPSSDRVRTGLMLDVPSSGDILLEAPPELR